MGRSTATAGHERRNCTFFQAGELYLLEEFLDGEIRVNPNIEDALDKLSMCFRSKRRG
ncbi:hypothetical protein PPMP20_36590 [Paraburkholderia phymatum]|uniref:hypothetical protein n=1 Tax=Paraburkholderia phymatum TaxID=148447 RepID=UPI0012FE0DCA|nr:hypothetical protein [Paraburkholderia phymatum]